MNVNRGLLLTALLAVVAAAALLLTQPYSVRSPWQPYVEPARRYLRAALAQDSVALSQQSVGTAPVIWALHAARTNPSALAEWAAVLRPFKGRERGDTTEVAFQTSTTTCHLRPVIMSFVREKAQTRVLLATSSCF